MVRANFRIHNAPLQRRPLLPLASTTVYGKCMAVFRERGACRLLLIDDVMAFSRTITS